MERGQQLNVVWNRQVSELCLSVVGSIGHQLDGDVRYVLFRRWRYLVIEIH